ncbi:hypothetical protein, partial [Klebsiella pneumoniae]|uniref:hypothetical protein n=1 Tax=Klebsiella pneumoniae TaxID=573 RepID=UPI002152C8D3
TAQSGMSSPNEARTKLMNRTAQEVQTCWLESRQPEDRTCNEAEQFSDECWKNGLRLDKSQSVHYQLLMETIRRTLIPRPK